MSTTTNAPSPARRALPPLMSVSDAAADRLRSLYANGQDGKLLRISVKTKGCSGLSYDLGWVDATGAGTVDSFTVVHRAPRPEADVPYVIARVRLDVGVVLLTRLEGREPDHWSIGDAVRVEWAPADDGRALPVFVHASGA